MRVKRKTSVAAALLAVVALSATPARAQETTHVSVGVDLVSRYIWRGIDAADAPSVQPSISFGLRGWELGTWGSYALSNRATAGDEIDLYLRHTHEWSRGGSAGVVVTDYYYPNAGKGFSDFHDYDAPGGPGAHVLELGASATLPSHPLTLAAYVDVYNDAGHNVYVQADYPLTLAGTSLDFFAAATPGSDRNPGYYGTDDFAFLNVGVSAKKEVRVSDAFSLPVWVSWSVNPNLDIAYLVVGMSL
jgi:uncharacterized protein (TIGR02001 family)